MLDGMPANFKPERAAPKRDFDHEACELYIEHGRENADKNDGWLCVAAGLLDAEAPASLRTEWDATLRRRWRWGVDASGNVIMPHYDVAGTLTAAKLRALDGSKRAFPGSQFKALYGSWLPRQHQGVILVEGENDAAYASLQDPSVDVLGLPSGAGKFSTEWAALVADTYYLAFDADDAGLRATRTWIEALDGRDVRVCRLPRGHDLRSAQPRVDDLLRHAVQPPTVPTSVFVDNDRFERTTNNDPRPLCSWYCTPVARLERGDETVEPAIEVDVVAAGRVERDVLRASDLHSASRLRTWAGARSLDCMANDADVQQLNSYLLAGSAILPEVFQTARVGAHSAPERYRYAGRTAVGPRSSIGRLPWRYVGAADAHDHVHLDDAHALDFEWLTSLLELNSPDVMTPLLAWLVAAARRDEMAQFPIMFLGGSSGSGKTTTAALATQLLGSTLTASLASITQFALIRALSMTTTVPVFVDEWSLQSRTDARETLQAVVPIIYDGGITARGRADLTTVEFRLTAPVLVAGEDSFHLDRESDRMIGLRLQRGSQNFSALQRLAGQPLERFAYWLYDWLVQADLPELPSRELDRPRYNRAVLEAGWVTLQAYLDHAAEAGADVPALPALDLSQLDITRDMRENEYEAFLQEGQSLRDPDGIPLVWPDPQGQGVYARFRMLTSSTNMGRVDVELPGRSRAMRQYFADRYELRDERVSPPFSEKSVRAVLIVGLLFEDLPQGSG